MKQYATTHQLAVRFGLDDGEVLTLLAVHVVPCRVVPSQDKDTLYVEYEVDLFEKLVNSDAVRRLGGRA